MLARCTIECGELQHLPLLAGISVEHTPVITGRAGESWVRLPGRKLFAPSETYFCTQPVTKSAEVVSQPSISCKVQF